MIAGRSFSLGLASMVMAGSILLSRLMGLVRDKVIAYHFGATLESDVYFAAFVVPDFINYLLAGGYFAITLIPLLSERFTLDEEDGWRFFSAALTWITIAIVLLTLIGEIFAPQLAELVAPGFSPEAQDKLTLFLRIILPAQVFFLTGSCFTALLYLRKQFLVPALTPLLYNGGIILGGLVMLDRGMEGFCWGVLVGSLAGNLLLPLIAAAGGSRPEPGAPAGIRFAPRLSHPSLRTFVLLALPLMIGQSVVVLDEQLLRIFGSLAEEGAVSWLNYARRIMLVPVGVVAQAAGVASYPFLAGLAARKADTEFSQTLATALRNTAAVIVPVSLWMLLAAPETVGLIFMQGRFGSADLSITAFCLRVMLLGVFLWGVQQVLGRAFYARKDTLTPSLAGTGATLAALPVYWLLGRSFGAAGLAAASLTSVGLYTAAMAVIWRRRHGAAAFSGLLRTLGASVAVALASLAPAAFARWAVGLLAMPYHLEAFTMLCASGVVFVAVYILLARRVAPQAAAPFEAVFLRIRSRVRPRA
ncbi:murein biosynthesis integral membrane protein MurJ [Oceanidesulfovibrio indonesiensis]|uniref:Probable lipid II flippase MurJ n=1 Tax=Oceanidesulfovibrio indonesiensis TaxID=54767 RepID=A0A7M3MI13_9BACT|nr:murein biosynthesis integral membrane protein MurJ [Oceanidesulfovibrio indonesiensis]TVM19323.1 murein biosynthesis integral membrane protein MurJ [Oceanidesulfovibrio indonesiensis]